ncbi:MAG: M48 family metalloprotease [Halieaceae bacterium]|jgi:predicted Zn-dependent protease|nr:M48 family metalloprotease [Halieaceae bacterium]
MQALCRAVAALLCALLTLSASAQRDDLPSFGETGVLPVGQEYMMGRVWLMSYRRQVPAVEDPLLQDYLENLIFRLAETSELKDRRLELITVDNPTINAFAVPGGVVGVHNGLVRQAGSEAQLASVLTHELAHVSQRHFSRGVEDRERSRIPTMVGLLGGLVAIAAGSGEAGVAAITGTQAAAQSTALRFSRAHEQEADRIGIQNLARAGYDPNGAANMFQVMQSLTRGSRRPPEFLLTHPLTETRIADARNRAREYPRRVYADNPDFQLMRMRVQAQSFRDDDEAEAWFRKRLERKGRNAEAYQYGLILVLTRQRRYAEAMELLTPLREYRPDNLPYILAEADIHTESGEFDDALSLLGRHWMLMPGNYPLTMAVSKTHLRAGRYTEAEKILDQQSKRRGSDPYVWYVLAETQGLTGNNYGLHQSRAQYFYLNGEMLAARSQLGYALQLAPDEVAKERIRTEQRYVESAARALGQMR